MNLNNPFFVLIVIASLLSACKANTGSETEVAITDGWVRENAPGQSVGAAYMTLNSPKDSTLIKVETQVANVVEIHSMSMENNVMKMRMLNELQLKAGTPERLAPGGFHLMLFDLKTSLKAGENAVFKLSFKDNAGNITKQNVSMPIKAAE